MKFSSIYLGLSIIGLLFIQACGGGGGGSNNSPQPEQSLDVPAGIYFGTITPSGSASDEFVGFITTNNRAAIIDTDSAEFFIGTISGDQLTGKLYSDVTVDATAQITTASGGNITGTYSSSVANGTFAGTESDLFNRSSSFAKLEGVWVDNFYTDLVGISTWVIQADGTFEINTSFNCFATGAFSLIDPTKNEYQFTATVSNCGIFDGAISGVSFTADSNGTDNVLPMLISNSATGAYSVPVKQ